MNEPTRLKPMGDRVVTLLDSRKAVTDGGIVIPERAQRPEEWGLAIMSGPNCQHVIPGDRVYVPPHLGTHYIENGQDYIIIEEFRILCREQRVYSNASSVPEQSEAFAEVEPGKVVAFDPAAATPIVGCSACGEDHPIKFKDCPPEVIEGETYDRKGVCPTTGTDVFSRNVEEPTDGAPAHQVDHRETSIDDDLGELDPAKACKLEGGACESCQ